MFKRSRAQSTLEYGLVIAAVVAALLAMNFYIKKGVQGKLRDSTDNIGRQFEPNNFNASWQTQSSGDTRTEESRDVGNGTTTSTVTSGEIVTRSEHETWGNAPSSKY